jgi:hypothetical protein
MVLRRGDRGENVKAVQRALQRSGFDIDDDGDFGRRTETAVKEFQSQRGLDVDGRAGADTLTALGLDPDTLEEVGPEGEDVTTIDFTEEDVAVPAVVEGRIGEYVDAVVDRREKSLGSLLSAVDNFETTMSFASAEEANPDVLGALLSKAYEMTVDELVSQVPGLSTVKSFFDAATEELERAGRASESHTVGDWIKDQRAAVDELIQNVNRDDLQFETQETYLDQDTAGRETFFQQIVETTERLKATDLPPIDVLEQKLYEQWVNAQFDTIGEDEDGCIEYRFEYEDNTFDFVSCTVKAPSGDKIASALNRLLDRKQLPGVRSPLDFKVRKRACFRVENFVGGTGWDCGWLDEDNEIFHVPTLPNAEKGLKDPGWRVAVNRFGSAD